MALINDGFWHQVVGVADVSNSLLRIYVDGTQANTAAYTGTSESGTSPLHIGNSPDSAAQEWEDGIDEVRVAGAARNAKWVATEFNNQSDPYAFYRILPEELPADVELDITGTQITLEAWVKYDAAASGTIGILAKNGWADGYRLTLQLLGIWIFIFQVIRTT